MTNETMTVTTPSDTAVQVQRDFGAPAQLVWDAHTKPELFKQWLLGPDGWEMPVCEMDVRVGGAYRCEWSDTTGHEPSFGVSGTFSVVEPITRLVTVERMDGFDGESVNTYTFEERNGRTTLTLLMDFGSQEARDGAMASGMTDGVTVSYERLASLLPTF